MILMCNIICVPLRQIIDGIDNQEYFHEIVLLRRFVVNNAKIVFIVVSYFLWLVTAFIKDPNTKQTC